MNNKHMLNDDTLDNVSGGYLFNSNGIIGADKDHQWEGIDNKGDVKGRFSNYDEACRNASAMGFSTEAIGWDELCKLRQQNGK